MSAHALSNFTGPREANHHEPLGLTYKLFVLLKCALTAQLYSAACGGGEAAAAFLCCRFCPSWMATPYKNTSGLHRLAESCERSQQATVNTGESRWQKQIILFEKYFTADTYNTLIILIYICIKYTLNMIIFKDLIHYRQVGQGDINKENTLL